MGFKIGRGSTIFLGCKFDSTQGLTIGDNAVINSNCRIDTRGGVTIGNNVSISSDVIILTADHDMDNKMNGRSRETIIEDYVWIGTRAMILPGCKIKKGAIVAAGSVVSREVASMSVVAGIPATTIKINNRNLNYTASYKRLFQ